MIDYFKLRDDIKNNKFKNNYILMGVNEHLIKECVEDIVKRNVKEEFLDLNYIKFDGFKLDFQEVINACETLPFFDEKKVVVIYRGDFLRNSKDKEHKKNFKEYKEYRKNVPSSTILITYCVFDNKREKIPAEVKSLSKNAELVEFKQLKGEALNKVLRSLFKEKGKEIGRAELSYLSSVLDGNIDVINNEIEKLINYCKDRPITKEDIIKLMPPLNENDIFNLVDCISKRKIKDALDILSELINRGEKEPMILFMILRQYRLLYKIKSFSEQGYDSKSISKELKINEFVGNNLYILSKKYSFITLEKSIEKILETEKAIKSTSAEDSLELLLISLGAI